MVFKICIIVGVIWILKSSAADGVGQTLRLPAAVRQPRSVKSTGDAKVKIAGSGLVKLILASFEHIKKFVKTISNWFVASVEEEPNKCYCMHSVCGCCFYLYVPEIRLHSLGCVGVEYISENRMLAISFTFDGETLLNTSIPAVKSASFPCITLPSLKASSHVCLELYNGEFSGRHYAACERIEVAVGSYCALPFELGCFEISGRSTLDHKIFTKMQNRTYILETATNNQLWKRSDYPWKYAVCSANLNYVSCYYQVAIMNVLFAFVYFLQM